MLPCAALPAATSSPVPGSLSLQVVRVTRVWVVSASAPASSALAVSMCLRVPAWSLGGISNRCIHDPLALLQLRVIAVTSAETCLERDPFPVFFGFFLLVLHFCMIYWAHFSMIYWSLHVCMLENFVPA